MQKSFHDPVFKRVEAHDGQTPSRIQDALGSFKSTLQLAKFVVHVKPERLKSARRRVFCIIMAAAENAADKIGELPRTLERRFLAVCDDRCCDGA